MVMDLLYSGQLSEEEEHLSQMDHCHSPHPVAKLLNPKTLYLSVRQSYLPHPLGLIQQEQTPVAVSCHQDHQDQQDFDCLEQSDDSDDDLLHGHGKKVEASVGVD